MTFDRLLIKILDLECCCNSLFSVWNSGDEVSDFNFRGVASVNRGKFYMGGNNCSFTSSMENNICSVRDHWNTS